MLPAVLAAFTAIDDDNIILIDFDFSFNLFLFSISKDFSIDEKFCAILDEDLFFTKDYSYFYEKNRNTRFVDFLLMISD